MATVEITSENFEAEVLNSDKPVLLDFWATWCGPCRMVAPFIAELSDERPDVKFGKVNTDEQPQLAQRFGISSIPTLIVFNGGNPVAKAIGARPKEDIAQLLEF